MTDSVDRGLLLQLLGTAPMTDDAPPGSDTARWDRILELAGNTLRPMMDYRVTERGIDVPETVSATLREARRGNAVTVARRRAALRLVCEALDAAGIPVTVLKGFALAHTAYPSPETRAMGDVDLWVGGGDLRPAVAALEPLGWRVPWWRQVEARQSPDGDEVGLQFGSSALMIELHRHPRSLSDTIPSALDEIWASRIPADLGGFRAFILPPDEMIIHLALHLAAHHRFVAAVPRLLDVTLVAQAAGPSFDWLALVECCRGRRIDGWVATTLGTAKLMLGAPVPPEALDAFGIPELDALCALAEAQAWSSGKAMAPQALLPNQGIGARARRLARRAKLVMTGRTPGTSGTWKLKRLLNRLRFAAQLTLPAVAREAWRGSLRGAEGEERLRLGAENQVLADAMRRQSQGTDHQG